MLNCAEKKFLILVEEKKEAVIEGQAISMNEKMKKRKTQ